MLRYIIIEYVSEYVSEFDKRKWRVVCILQ